MLSLERKNKEKHERKFKYLLWHSFSNAQFYCFPFKKNDQSKKPIYSNTVLTQQNKLAKVFQYVDSLYGRAGRSLRLFLSPIIGGKPRSMEEEGLLEKVARELQLLAASARYRLVQGMYVMC